MITQGAPETQHPQERQRATWLDARHYPISFRVLVAGSFLTISFLIVAEMALFLVVGIVVLIPLERVFQRHRMPILRPELLTDFMHIWVTTLLSVVPIFFLASVLRRYQIEAVTEAIQFQPGWLLIVEAFVFREFLIYWAHRWTHEIPFLRRFHAVHHSVEYLDWAPVNDGTRSMVCLQAWSRPSRSR